jgi:hypothetical protein
MSKTHQFLISELNGFSDEIILASSSRDRKKLVIVSEIKESNIITYLHLTKKSANDNNVFDYNKKFPLDSFSEVVIHYNNL